MKQTFRFMIAGCCAIALAACNDDEKEPTPTPDPDPDPVEEVAGVYILNQGNYGHNIDGDLTYINLATGNDVQDVFLAANGRSLGDTPQCGVVYGSKIYLGIYGSNVIEIIDKNTYKSVKQISVAADEANGPRSMVADGGKVYISMFSGYVSRLDTLSMTIDKTVKVGPNPETMALLNGYLYVPNSDGMNWEAGYGTTASKVSLSTFTEESTFTVELNPTQFVTNGTDLFLLCMGNYYDINSAVYRIGTDGRSTKIADATLVDIRGDKLYYINAPYYATEFTYGVYDIATGATSAMISDEGVDSPAGLGVDPATGNIVITSYPLDNGYADYLSPGYARVYSAEGEPIGTYGAGTGPCGIFFGK